MSANGMKMHLTCSLYDFNKSQLKLNEQINADKFLNVKFKKTL